MEKKEQFLDAVKQNEGFIYKIASIYTNSTEDKNDLVQEIIYQLWKSFDSFKHTSGINTWMYRVALNVAIYQLKKSKKRILTDPINSETLEYPAINNEDKEEKWKRFREQVNSLSLLDKGIVMLFLDNKSYTEIGEIMGISASNVGTKLNRIKEKLKTENTKSSSWK